MSIVRDVKTIAGLAAVGAVGFGVWKLWQQIPNLQGGLNDLQKNFDNFKGDTQKVLEDFQKGIGQLPIVQIATTTYDASSNIAQQQINAAQDADWSNPKTYAEALPIVQVGKAIYDGAQDVINGWLGLK